MAQKHYTLIRRTRVEADELYTSLKIKLDIYPSLPREVDLTDGTRGFAIDVHEYR